MAAHGDLDADVLLCCCKFDEALFQENVDNLTTLWDEYGIVGDLVVSRFFYDPIILSHHLLAIHEGLPTCQHQSVTCTRYPSPANQRMLQGPTC